MQADIQITDTLITMHHTPPGGVK